MEHVIEKRNFMIYKQILYMVDNYRGRFIGNNCGNWFIWTQEIIGRFNKFFHKKLGNWKFEKKIGHGYFVGNVFLTIKIYNGF